MSRTIKIPAQRRWLQDGGSESAQRMEQMQGKLSPMFELRDLPGHHECAMPDTVILRQAISQVLDAAERLLESDL